MPSYPEGTRQWAEQRLAELKKEIWAMMTGWMANPVSIDPHDLSMRVECYKCEGSGDSCRVCHGEGQIGTVPPSMWERFQGLIAKTDALTERLGLNEFPEADEPIYSPAELEAAGQGGLEL